MKTKTSDKFNFIKKALPLVVAFLAVLVKRDFPLKNLPGVGKYFGGVKGS